MPTQWKYFTGILFLLLSIQVAAQQKYWIFFEGKPGSNSSCNGQFVDRPVSKMYLQQLQQLQVRPLVISKWLNGVSALLTMKQEDSLRRLPFVRSVTRVSDQLYPATTRSEKGIVPENYAWKQVNGEVMKAAGLTGKNIKIGIIDGGFLEANTNSNLQHLFKNGQVKACRDFITPRNKDFYNSTYVKFSEHGTYVWQLIGGQSPDRQTTYGLASQATYYLARTDDADHEFRREEDCWVAALEWMDSLGVRLVNTSLGYSHDFDNPKENYTTAQMNGRTTIVARAARIAVQQKGMILVSSAGNEGNNSSWKIISSPSDVDGVIAVGATDKDRSKSPFSSEGPGFLTYVKPDLACFSGIGTSGAAPVITGLIACMLQRDPSLKSPQIKTMLRQAGHLYPYSNSYLGYGVPDAAVILAQLNKTTPVKNKTNRLVCRQEQLVLKDKAYTQGKVILFHKSNSRQVLLQELIDSKNGELIVKRKSKAAFTTIAGTHTLTEIQWGTPVN